MLFTIGLLLLGVWSAAATINAFRPIRQDWLLVPSMFWSWIVIGLPAQHVVIQMLLAGLLVWLGALDEPIGWIGMGLLVVSWVGSIILLIGTRKARVAVDEVLAAESIARVGQPVAKWRIVLAAPVKGRGIEKIKNVEFRKVAGRRVRLDVYRRPTGETGRPALLYIHGGAWTVGDKTEQGLPLLHHLARNGWVCFTTNYRLSPGATFPDHLVDTKAALAWIRAHGSDYGADPSFVAVAGGSAGGHLAALMGLTQGDIRYQEGFEAADTSVQATVPIYGIYDVTNRFGSQSDQFVKLLMEPLVMKAFLEDEPEKYRDASPIDLVDDAVSPFLIIQGDRDSLAPVTETRMFAERLRSASSSSVVYLEFPGAQHIFDLFYSLQSAQMVEAVLAFLHDALARSHVSRDHTTE